MKKIIMLLVGIIPCFLHAQEPNNGIRFEHNLTWEQITAKAKAQNKYIFMDCYATWCGPCKEMAANIFPLEEVGSFMNDKFINVEIQMDSTSKDDESVRNWYQTSHFIAKEYQINAYPTFLIFDAGGQIVHKFIGSLNKDNYLKKVKDALNPEKQYYTLVNHYKEHSADSTFLRNALLAALDQQDKENISQITTDYINCLKDPFRKENIQPIYTATASTQDKGFELLLHHMVSIDTALGINKAEDKLSSIIVHEEIYPLTKVGQLLPDWRKLTNTVNQRFPCLAELVIIYGKCDYYYKRKMWNEYYRAVVDYMRVRGSKTSNFDLNNYAWDAYSKCSDINILKEALEWSRRAIDNENPKPGDVDTYAHLWYKLGNPINAIAWESKAIALARAKTDDKKVQAFQRVVEKMGNGVADPDKD